MQHPIRLEDEDAGERLNISILSWLLKGLTRTGLKVLQ